MDHHLQGLPEQTRWVSGQLLAQLDFVSAQVKQLEQRLEELVEVTPEMQWLLTLPGVGVILAATMALEIGEIARFPSAMHLASYSGTTPRVHASGGKVRYGSLRVDVNRYLKWAFAEAANSVALNHKRCPERHVSQLYRRLPAQGTSQSDWSGGPASGRSRLSRAAGQTDLSDPSLGRGRTSQV